jgi:hypothetical protein
MFTEHLGVGLREDAGGALTQPGAYLARRAPVQINGGAQGVRLGPRNVTNGFACWLLAAHRAEGLPQADTIISSWLAAPREISICQ